MLRAVACPAWSLTDCPCCLNALPWRSHFVQAVPAGDLRSAGSLHHLPHLPSRYARVRAFIRALGRRPVLRFASPSAAAKYSTRSCCCLSSAGKFADVSGLKECKPCVAGRISKGNVSECTPCPLGQFQPNPADSRCAPCAIGRYANLPGFADCINCTSALHCLSCSLCHEPRAEISLFCRPSVVGGCVPGPGRLPPVPRALPRRGLHSLRLRQGCGCRSRC